LLRRFNDSFAFDRELFDADVRGSLAWARALADAGALTAEECAAIVGGLEALAAPDADDDFEDVHSYVEAKLRERVGALAGKLHTGRSRNDQVATDLKLWLKAACDEALQSIDAVSKSLVRRAAEEAATPMPGYTHLNAWARLVASRGCDEAQR
jgi:argininosuccinate lyase/amino-acid N-acetyltransferase